MSVGKHLEHEETWAVVRWEQYDTKSEDWDKHERDFHGSLHEAQARHLGQELALATALGKLKTRYIEVLELLRYAEKLCTFDDKGVIRQLQPERKCPGDDNHD